MVDFKYADLFLNSHIDKQLVITTDDNSIILTNADLFSESFSLSENICTQEELRFGSCESSFVKFKIANVFDSFKNKQITIVLFVGGNTDEGLNLGKYKIFSDTPTADRRYREIVAYDAMYGILNADVAEWYNTILPNPDSIVTLKTFRTSFIQHFGLEQEEIDLVNDGMTVEKTIEPSELSGKDVITAICEINGCFGKISRDGKFKYIVLPKFTEDTNKFNIELYRSCTYEDYITDEISKIHIRQQENDIGKIYPGEQIVDSDNVYAVDNNFLVYGKNDEELGAIAKNLYGVISGVRFVPSSISCVGNPCLEPGDLIQVNSKYAEIKTYILERTLNGIQSLEDTYETNGDKKYSKQINSTQKSIVQLKNKTNILERTVEENRLTITNLESDVDKVTQETSELKQTSSEIKASVSNLEKRIDQEVETVEVEYEPTLYNYPAMDWCTNIPVDGTVSVTDDLHFTYTEEDYRNHLGYVAYGIETNTMYRFSKNEESGGYYWKPVVNSDMSYVMEKVSELQITVDGIEANVAETYQTIDDMVNYATIKQLNSSIEQTANSIISSVSAKYQTKDAMEDYATIIQMESSIRQSASNIKAEVVSQIGGNNSSFGWRMTSTGFEMYSNNNKVFSCNSNGIAVEGQIKATSGYIGKTGSGFNIADDAIYNGTDSMSSKEEGVYIGVNGINLGGNFKVSKSGDLTLTGLFSSINLGDSSLSMQLDKDKLVFKDVGSDDYNTSIQRYKIQVGASNSSNNVAYLTSTSLSCKSIFEEFAIKSGTNKNIVIKGTETCIAAGGMTDKLGFFGTSRTASKQTVNKLSTSSTTAQAITKLNELLDALYAYNLIYTT